MDVADTRLDAMAKMLKPASSVAVEPMQFCTTMAADIWVVFEISMEIEETVNCEAVCHFYQDSWEEDSFMADFDGTKKFFTKAWDFWKNCNGEFQSTQPWVRVYRELLVHRT